MKLRHTSGSGLAVWLGCARNTALAAADNMRRVGAPAPQCAPLHQSQWPGAQRQWHLARTHLGIASASPELAPPLEAPNIGQCRAMYRGWSLAYIPVFKVNSALICANLRAINDGSDPVAGHEFSFTFVREPLSHFESAYAEIVNRALTTEHDHYHSCKQCYTFIKQLDAPDAAALAFVHDMLQGCVVSPCCKITSAWWSGSDVHVLPQTSFIAGHLYAEPRTPLHFNFTKRRASRRPLHFVGQLERMTDDWASIGRIIPEWPAFNSSLVIQWASSHPTDCDTHKRGCEQPSKPHRDAVGRLLANNSWERLAVCRILLADYGCFSHLYALPADCALAIEEMALNQSCPVQLRQFVEVGQTSLRLP